MKNKVFQKLSPFFDAEKIEAGCDEAGRGCLAGAVFAAAVILPKDFEHEWLNDSKLMTENRRLALREIIRSHIALVFYYRYRTLCLLSNASRSYANDTFASSCRTSPTYGFKGIDCNNCCVIKAF